MAKYGSDDLVITVGGTDLSNYVDEIDGVDYCVCPAHLDTAALAWIILRAA